LKLNFYIIFFILICFSNVGKTQILPVKDSLQTKLFKKDSLSIDLTSGNLNIGLDSIPADSLSPSSNNITLSEDALEQEVDYGARDTVWNDVTNNNVHLFGGAFVNYSTIKITAKYIIFNFESNTLEAYDFIPDSLASFAVVVDTSEAGKPTFIDGESTFTYKKLRYNFQSKKAFVDQALTKESDFYLHGNQTKFVSKGVDSLQLEDIIYNKNAYITTCDAEHPHFGIRASKLKFIPNKVAVMSLANLEISDIPTPLFLPFGFFPLFKGKSSGLILPKSYDYQEDLGLGFRDIGYYFPISQYMDATVTGDIYSRGSHGIRGTANYNVRYKYEGAVNIGYTNNIFESNETGQRTSSKSFGITIRHSQHAKAHPYRRLSGSVNIQANRFDQRTFVDPRSAAQNSYNSNFSFSHSMPGTPFNFTASFNHSQNTTTRRMNIVLPKMTLNMNTITPFKSKSSTKERWYDNIAVSYKADFDNATNTTDTTLFTNETLRNLRTGLKQTSTVSTNFRIMKYFNLNPSANYEEIWLLNRFENSFDPTPVIVKDTIKSPEGEILGINDRVVRYGTVDTLRQLGFYSYRTFRTGFDLNTKVFSTLQFRKGFIRGIRHQVTPSINFTYTPMNTDRYQRSVDTDSRPEFNRPRAYSIYQESPFGALRGTDAAMAINYSLLNNFEAKIATKDTIRKVKLLNNIGVTGFYNAVADSLRWSDIRVSGNTNLFGGITNINLSLNLSPYVFVDQIKTNTTRYSATKNVLKAVAYRDFNAGINTGFTVQQLIKVFQGKDDPQNRNTPKPNPDDKNTKEGKTGSKKDDKIIELPQLADWFEQLSFSHNFQFRIQNLDTRDTAIIITNTVSMSGNIALTQNWNVQIGSIGYDFKQKRITYPSFTFIRNLHCWKLSFDWIPQAGTYGFFIGVNSGSLDFLKYNYGRQNQGGVLGRR
jgi:hypothetical protein